MNVFKTLRDKFPPVPALGALPVGVGVFLLIRLLEGTIQGPMAVNVVIEEAAKFALFVIATLAAGSTAWSKFIFNEQTDPDRKEGVFLLFPLLCAVVFGITENILYFLSFPTSSIYKRLLYSYPIHLNTALLYALAFLSKRIPKMGLYFLIGVLYHLGLNHLSLRLPEAGIYSAGILNLGVFFLLYWRTRIKLIERSIQACWNPR